VHATFKFLMEPHRHSDGMSAAAEQVWRRSKTQLDLLPLLIEMIEAHEITLRESLDIITELRQHGLVVYVAGAPMGLQFQWTTSLC
jgi:hypothetical protein